jgi:flagellar hook-basal body complex protein FliE
MKVLKNMENMLTFRGGKLMEIRPISTPVTGATRSAANEKPSSVRSTSFNNMFQQVYSAIGDLDRELLASQIDLVTGNARDMHTAVLSAEKASLVMDLVISVRNKAIEAYQEIMRMPL